jgi:hypothetical protein
MSVDPLKGHALPSTDMSRVAEQKARRAEGSAEERPTESGHAAADSVELSPASRGLGRAEASEGVPQGTLSDARIRQVLRRLVEGFYDTTDVRAEVARRIRPDFGNSRPE